MMTNEQNEDETMNCGLSMDERDLLYSKLDVLPDTMPPRAVWKRIEEQAKAEGLLVKPGVPEGIKWLAGAAIAATVAMMALNLPMIQPPEIEAGKDCGSIPCEMEADGSRLNLLKAQSRDLESNLRALPRQPAVRRVSTATTISELENQIASIDMRLNDRATNLDAEQEEIYWQERVRLMNLLVQLRSSQAQRITF